MQAQYLLDLLESEDLSSDLGTFLSQGDVNDNEPILTELTNMVTSNNDVIQSYPLADNISLAKDLQIPVDPKQWDTTHVLRWVEWNLRQCNTDEAELWRIREQLRLQSIKGYHLTKWTGFEYDRLFNYSSEYLQREMRNWLQALPRSSEDYYIGNAQMGYGYDQYNMNNQCNDPIMYPPVGNMNNMNPGEEDFVLPDIPGLNDAVSPFNQGFAGQRFDDPQYHQPYVWNTSEDNRGYCTQTNSGGSECSSDSSSSDDDDDYVPNAANRNRGRPSKQKPNTIKRRHPILYKFILEYLNDPSTRGYVEWVDKSEGLFKFNSRRKDKFAELWSRAKGKKQPMTYQNMARALRNYTRESKKIMERVPKKLHYKFMPGYIE